MYVLNFSVQVCGREVLEKTTLKSLGLNSGKAILRLIYRDHEQLKTQAHVSTPLLPKTVTTVDDSSNKDYQRLPSSTLHCNKTINASKIENQEVSEGEVKMDSTVERVDALSNEEQERDISKMREIHSIASKHEDRDDGTNRHIAGTCAKVKENEKYEIKFVRCNCAYVQLHSGDAVTYREFCVTARGEKRFSVQSSRDSSVAEGRIAG